MSCYLGASAVGREESVHPVTGLHEGDDLVLARLQIPTDSTDPKDARPLPILNAGLNVVGGKDVGLKTRTVRSFAFTPLYAGFTHQVRGTTTLRSEYAPTAQAGSMHPESKGGISLGTAAAVSGSTANAKTGFYSAPALAFLLTLFDVRLGWWVSAQRRRALSISQKLA